MPIRVCDLDVAYLKSMHRASIDLLINGTATFRIEGAALLKALQAGHLRVTPQDVSPNNVPAMLYFDRELRKLGIDTKPKLPG